MQAFRPTNNRLIFKFLDNTSGGNFTNKTSWGFEIQQKTEEIRAPRWGMVTHIGSDVSLVKVGQYILIEAMMWTLGFDFNKETFWTTAEEKLLATSEELPL